MSESAGGIALEDRIRGCFLGGAVGDALGAPVEFWALREIRSRFGEAGVTGYVDGSGRMARGGTGEFTDDTQMSLFTAEGLIRAHNRWLIKGMCHVPTLVNEAYIRWLWTQERIPNAPMSPSSMSGWLIHEPVLHQMRSPGTTCLTALRRGGSGTMEHPVNDSKGCGAIMRIAPAGLMGGEDPFQLGCELAALTHGNPSGYLAAGFLAHLIALTSRGMSLPRAVDATMKHDLLKKREDGKEVRSAVRKAVTAARHTAGNAQDVEALGEGWIAEECLAIALYCSLIALREEDNAFERGVLLSVNHSGDSDSTAAVTGNLVGTMVGARGIPSRFLDALAGRDVVTQVADDAVLHFDPARSELWRSGEEPRDIVRYPAT